MSIWEWEGEKSPKREEQSKEKGPTEVGVSTNCNQNNLD